ncbi:metal-sulfur cluster biosynthetic enzyme [Actinoplanes tereljensis]
MTDTDKSVDEVPAWLAAERAEAGTPADEVPAAEVSAPSEPVAPEPVAAEPVAAEPVVAAGPVAAAETAAAAGGVAVKKASLDDVEEAMKDVVDPELGINVVDLGLVYGTFVDDDNIVTIDMTLTSAACPLTDVIEEQTRAALTTGPGGGLVQDFRINWVWLPPWGPDKITDDGREQLRALGFNV